MKNILVTGGAGYIGSHTVVELLNNEYNVIILDNFNNSNPKIINSIKKITGKDVKVYTADLKDEQILSNIFEIENIDAVIHFAAHKAVGESVKDPLKYYTNNVYGTINLLNCMNKYEVKNLVFSSSATVYGCLDKLPMVEESQREATNAYGRSKIIIEDILKDLYISDKEWNIIALRYFNPLGAHPSGLMGEQPNGIPNNLVPYILQVLSKNLPCVNVFGDDYNTVDGTGVRDYVHIMDLAMGHIKALSKIYNKPDGFEVYNLGSGKGFSVFEIINAFEEVSGKKIPYKIIERRPGDIAISYADTSKAKKILKWTAKESLLTMCRDAWKWAEKNPNGFN